MKKADALNYLGGALIAVAVALMFVMDAAPLLWKFVYGPLGLLTLFTGVFAIETAGELAELAETGRQG